ncbi:hypothetical protein OAK47_01345 [Planctomycetaceae bacterium]|jgi:hypothetical protein|nr:hypothetical protein [Planctomycetaceae bacterium]MDC0273844.1 hypothetical protein [Planctomycetaceae bacterium]MDC0308267.1 hypothetical protein [Planctomycetaceae bacterium]MDG2388266.1 hypothetical protein [Planctomycetaceae bacterium]
MPRLFWPNFDFEHELGANYNWQPTEKLRQLNARFAAVFGALCDDGELIVLPDTSQQQTETKIDSHTIRFVQERIVRESVAFRGPDWKLVPWGVTLSLQELAEARGWSWEQPPVDVVKKLNDRATSFEWEQERRTLPDGATLIESEVALFEALKNIPTSRWVIKARFGMSARERIVGTGTTLTDSQRGWVNKRLVEQGQLFLEPWLEIESEVGLQFDIPQVGPVKFLAALPLLNSETGEYRGSRLHLTEREQVIWQPAIQWGQQIAQHAQQLGYFGPLGIDAAQYRQGNELVLRPVMDINARWTMGRMAYEWGQRVGQPKDTEWRIADVAG